MLHLEQTNWKVTLLTRILFVSCLAVAFSAGESSAAPILLDLTSGSFSAQLGGSIDTYVEDGYRLQVAAAGNHIDLGGLGDIDFHNGPANPTTDNNLVLTFGTGAFDLLSVDIAGYFNGATSLELIGSNGTSLMISSTGVVATPGLMGVTSVTLSIPFVGPGNGQRVGLNGFSVQAAAVPEPASMLAWSLIAGVGAVGYRFRKRKGVSA